MAKRFSPFPIESLPETFAKVVRYFTVNDINVAAFNAGNPTPSPEWLAEQLALFNAAQAAWARISTWKKTRWSLCAIRTFGNSLTLTGTAGFSGYSLYVKCWLEQKPLPDKQPISPCSARVTDPFASPWDYQP